MNQKKQQAMTIAVVQQKGGAGKTTIATNLAAEFSKIYKTILVDCDRQQSCRIFGAGRSEALGEINNLTIVGKIFLLPNETIASGKAIRQELKPFKDEHQIVVMDVGGAQPTIAKAVASLADLVIIPIQPGILDVDSAGETIRDMEDLLAINEFIKVRVILNRRKDNTNLSKEVAKFEFLEGHEDIDVMLTSLGDRIIYGESNQGLSVVEIDRRSIAAAEILALMEEIEELLSLEEYFNGQETTSHRVAA